MNFATELTPAQTIAMTACMLAISHVDGVHPSETALIRSFYEGEYQVGMLPFDKVQSMHGEAAALLQGLESHEFANLLVTSCLMTGYADGKLSDAERQASFQFASLAGLSEVDCLAALSAVRDSLLGSLSHLPDTGSVAALASDL